MKALVFGEENQQYVQTLIHNGISAKLIYSLWYLASADADYNIIVGDDDLLHQCIQGDQTCLSADTQNIFINLSSETNRSEEETALSNLVLTPYQSELLIHEIAERITAIIKK